MSEEELIEELSSLFNDIEDEEERYTDTIFRKITNLQQENKQLKSILTELEEWLCGEKIVVYNVDNKVGILRGDILNKIQELKEKYSLGGDNEKK